MKEVTPNAKISRLIKRTYVINGSLEMNAFYLRPKEKYLSGNWLQYIDKDLMIALEKLWNDVYPNSGLKNPRGYVGVFEYEKILSEFNEKIKIFQDKNNSHVCIPYHHLLADYLTRVTKLHNPKNRFNII